MKNRLKKIIMSKLPERKVPAAVALMICIPFMALLYSCGGGLPSGSDHVNRNIPVDMGSYTVNYPAGDDWLCHAEKGIGKVTFTRDKSSTGSDLLGVLAGGSPEGSTVIEIFENRIMSDTFKLAEKDAAEDYMNEELKYMKKNGVKRDMYDLEEVIKIDTVINDKKFYGMRYELYNIRNAWGDNFVSENILALYYPANYLETRRFYVFLINDFSNSVAIGRDAGQLYPVLSGFKLKSEVVPN